MWDSVGENKEGPRFTLGSGDPSLINFLGDILVDWLNTSFLLWLGPLMNFPAGTIEV